MSHFEFVVRNRDIWSRLARVKGWWAIASLIPTARVHSPRSWDGWTVGDSAVGLCHCHLGIIVGEIADRPWRCGASGVTLVVSLAIRLVARGGKHLVQFVLWTCRFEFKYFDPMRWCTYEAFLLLYSVRGVEGLNLALRAYSYYIGIRAFMLQNSFEFRVYYVGWSKYV